MGVCFCNGGREQRKRWRRLDEPDSDGKTTLYCLDCRKRWKSKRNYAAGLEHHKPRSRSGLTDSEILDLIKTGVVAIDIYNAEIWKSGKRLKKEHRTSKGGTYRFVSICSDGRKKKVSVHRLVWMAYKRELVPDGCNVDHKEDQEDDRIGNLQLLTASENQQKRSDKIKQRQQQEQEF